MTDPITAFFKELWRDKDKERQQMIAERLQMMQLTNRELSAAVSRTLLALLRLKRKRKPPAPGSPSVA
jgi:hypothetical protein